MNGSTEVPYHILEARLDASSLLFVSTGRPALPAEALSFDPENASDVYKDVIYPERRMRRLIAAR